jgi:uncharacterized membrane protein YphA (DoxX/SURF4 family)
MTHSLDTTVEVGSCSLFRRVCRSGLPLLVARLLLGGMFVWMGLAKTGYPELVLKRAEKWNTPTVVKLVKNHPAKPAVQQQTGWVELDGPVGFLKLIREYRIFPASAWPLLNLTAVAMPWVEVLCGLLLILGVSVRGAAGLLLALLLMFTTMIVIRGVRVYNAQEIAFCAIKFNCGCGSGDVFICHKIAENTTLILLAIVNLFSRSRRFCLCRNILPAAKSVPASAETNPRAI